MSWESRFLHSRQFQELFDLISVSLAARPSDFVEFNRGHQHLFRDYQSPSSICSAVLQAPFGALIRDPSYVAPFYLRLATISIQDHLELFTGMQEDCQWRFSGLFAVGQSNLLDFVLFMPFPAPGLSFFVRRWAASHRVGGETQHSLRSFRRRKRTQGKTWSRLAASQDFGRLWLHSWDLAGPMHLKSLNLEDRGSGT